MPDDEYPTRRTAQQLTNPKGHAHMPSHTKFEPRVRDGVMHIEISTTRKGASLDLDRTSAAARALRRSAESGWCEIGAVLITGSGPNFCSGGDVHAFAAASDPRALVKSMAVEFHHFIEVLTNADVPTIAAVQGWAVGAGMSVACATDIVVGGPSTKFKPGYPSLAFTPDGGLTWTLPRIVGERRAQSILLADRTIRDEEALRLGLLTESVAEKDIKDHAERIAVMLAAGPRRALRRSKELLRRSGTSSLSAHLDAEATSIADCADSSDGRAAVAAFVDR
ncbi:enoyl-CoA hydratase-related protein [Rhodococcus oxybenzonivorans]|uniref:enoyl-CoA hydratase/isomerase family protein n=1 Tax=Rhodococcus oxybenzonivorans TaxID=1990687 RepID=UPI002953BC79|nr:enoyl-CoA hydratase-related protein [Rhodococcus oxybenzonivorans]MDV7355293.1 enoyl-CoA hydratase-related protein [Rhodococcus oxybenzonivorans]